PTCEGLGVQHGANSALLIRDVTRLLRDGALSAWPDLNTNKSFLRFAEALARHLGFSLDRPVDQLDAIQQRALLHGTGEAWIHLAGSGYKSQYKGLSPAIDEISRVSAAYRQRLDHLVSEVPCPACRGSRLRDDAAACRFSFGEGRELLTLGELSPRPLGGAPGRVQSLKLSQAELVVARDVLRAVGH